jgi:hypothetical protein
MAIREPRLRTERPSGRRGSLTTELILLLPILSVLALGIVQVSMALSATERLTHASRVGARVAAQGGTTDDVEHAVRCALGTGAFHNAEVEITPCDHTNCHVVAQADEPNSSCDRPDHGGAIPVPEEGRELDHRACRAEYVRVSVRVRAGCVVPGPLIIFGCKDEKLHGWTVMRKE